MRSWMVALAALGLAAGLAPFVRGNPARAVAGDGLPAVALVSSAVPAPHPRSSEALAPPDLNGLDLAHIGLDDDGATASLDRGRTARLTVDPSLQAVALDVMAARHIPEAAIVLLDPQSGDVLVYANHVEQGPVRDLAVEARAPAASVFKIITASALVDDAGLGPDTRQCYSGGEERIVAGDLVDNPARDRWCVTLGGAMGRSVNAVFARLASKHLDKPMLERAGERFHFNASIPFDVAVAPSTLHVPADGLGFARTAAGFWSSTLSPLHAAWISAAIERGGEPIRPRVVRAVMAKSGALTEMPAHTDTSNPVVSASTATALTDMMEHTVAEGTSFRAFHDASRRPFLPGIVVAGKTGTLTDDHAQRYYTWFTGFAPSRSVPGVRPVAVAVLVVNGPSWRVKANTLAREVLQAYFAEQKVPSVSRPRTAMRDDAAD